MMRKDPDMILAGDIGGTKTNLAVFSRGAGWRKPLAEATFLSGDYHPEDYFCAWRFICSDCEK